MRVRLAVLMFLQYAFPGALLQLYSVHLQQLHFGPLEVGVCCAAQALAGVLVTLLVGQAADRWFAAERALAVCALLAGAALWVLPSLSAVPAVFAVTFLFWLLTSPVLVLGTALTFTHLRDPERDFGPVRLWGTVGWTAPCWLLLLATQLGWPKPAETPGGCADLFRLGALFAFALGLYALWLPHTPPRRGAPGRAAPLEALRLLRGRPFAVYCACTAGLCVTWPFTTQATPLLLQRLDFPLEWISPTTTLSQLTEVVTLALLPMLLLRLGVRGTMFMGLACWTLALALLTLGRPAGLVVASLGLNGVCVSGFLVAGQVFVNRQAGVGLRASVQALLTFVNGAGQLAGHLLVGGLRWLNGGELPQAFAVAAFIMSGMCLLFLFGFREAEPAPAEAK